MTRQRAVAHNMWSNERLRSCDTLDGEFDRSAVSRATPEEVNAAPLAFLGS